MSFVVADASSEHARAAIEKHRVPWAGPGAEKGRRDVQPVDDPVGRHVAVGKPGDGR